MPAPIRRLEGIIPILSMPFRDDDAIDLDSLVAQAEWLTGTGVQGVGFGLGCEIYRLTDAERDTALSTVARSLAGRLPIIAATSANSTRAALLRSETARDAGANVLMITPPAFASPTHDDLLTHYRTIADHVGLPIIVQDAPGLTNVTMSEDFLARLAREIDLIVAVKIEALPPAPKVGTVSARTGNLPATRSLFNRYLPLLSLSARTTDTFLFTQKEILRRRGILPAATMRHPSERVDAHYLRELDALLNDLGLASLGRNWNPIGDR